ncbi:MAG: glycogen synthase GlgA [Methylococcales bacterium]
MLRILFVVSELYPLIKTGGLADVAGSLPRALHSLDEDIRIVLPAYRDALASLRAVRPVAAFAIGATRVNVLESSLPESPLKVWLIDEPSLFDRPGNPYLAANGSPWPDNAQRFALFCRAVFEIAMGRAALSWQPDLVHCNDWQTGLVPALLSREQSRPATLFTVHNLAYQGLFPYQTFVDLNLPESFWAIEALEFHQQLSFIKGGLVYADCINTVSPHYATEIQTPAFGYGLDGLLRFRGEVLSGILNGIDTEIWNPLTDACLTVNYSSVNLDKKRQNKKTLLERFNLERDFSGPLIGCIGRLVHQKGVDLIIDVIQSLIDYPMNFVLIGSGEPEYETALRQCAKDFPEKIAVKIGYDEALAHLIEAGADLFLMPSRFEPCGLNQMYSLRYGTIPVVHNTGGLADTVVDTTPVTLRNHTATGLVFDEANAGSLMEAVKRALLLYENPSAWKEMQQTGMRQDFSWKHSAEQYLELYRKTFETLERG